MFDTHCHLFDKAFENNLDNVIISSRASGIKYFLVPAISVETSRQSIKIANTYENTFSAVGIHPTENLSLDNLDHDEKRLEELVVQKNVVAVGECGLDYYHFKSSPDIQKKYLNMQVKLALKYEKALILHSRQSTNDILEVIKNNWQEALRGKVIFHCASFEEELISFLEKHDCYLGIDGDITYDEFKQKQIKKLPIKKLLLETDSPYLLPEPLKSEKKYPNTPANLSIAADFVAQLLNMKKDNLIEQTTQNALNVFGIIS